MLPLQFGVPGGPELLVILLIILIPIALAYYVYSDATDRGDDNAALWAVVVGLAAVLLTPIGGLVVFAVYLWQRD